MANKRKRGGLSGSKPARLSRKGNYKDTKFAKAMGIVRGGAGMLSSMASLADAIANHPQWYESYPLDHLVALNFGMREKLGRTIPMDKSYFTLGSDAGSIRSATDSIFVMGLVVPTQSYVVRESAQIIMNKLRAASGSNITYTVEDLIAYILNAREIYALYAMCRRTVLCTKIVDVYDQDASFKYAIMSDFVGPSPHDISSIVKNLASDTVRLNRIAKVISAMIPLQMFILQRTSWMLSNIFADSKESKFSTKMFVLDDYGEWNISGTDVIRTGHGMAQMDLTAKITAIEAMVDKFTENVQNSRIAGDFMKAFGSFFTVLNPIDETTEIKPIYDEAALTQIQNMSIVPQPTSRAPPSVTIGVNAKPVIKYKAKNDTTHHPEFAVAAMSDHVFNSYKDSLSSAEIVSLSRLAAFVDVGAKDAANESEITVTSCGTEIITDYCVVASTAAPGTINIQYMGEYPNTWTDGTDTFMMQQSLAAEAWSRDDWAPMCVWEIRENSNGDRAIYTTLFDLSNWAICDENQASSFHDAAFLSLTAVPANLTEQSTFNYLV